MAQRLSCDERAWIEAMRAAGVSVEETARRLGRHRSTVYRELDRDSRHGRYAAQVAQAAAQARAVRPKRPKLAADPGLAAAVAQRLSMGWSPHAVCADLRVEGRAVCAETIYAACYDHSGSRGLPEGSWRCLPRRCRKRKQRGRHARKPSPLGDFRPIAQRSAAVEDRSEAGYWEGDDHRRKQPLSGRHSGGTLQPPDSRSVAARRLRRPVHRRREFGIDIAFEAVPAPPELLNEVMGVISTGTMSAEVVFDEAGSSKTIILPQEIDGKLIFHYGRQAVPGERYLYGATSPICREIWAQTPEESAQRVSQLADTIRYDMIDSDYNYHSEVSFTEINRNYRLIDTTFLSDKELLVRYAAHLDALGTDRPNCGWSAP